MVNDGMIQDLPNFGRVDLELGVVFMFICGLQKKAPR